MCEAISRVHEGNEGTALPTLAAESTSTSNGPIIDVDWWVYLVFLAFVIAMLLVDLKLFHRHEHEPSFRESLLWAMVWIGLGLLFGVGLLVFEGGIAASEYYAGFLIEKALSVDNMFVFVLIFSYFRVPFAYQHQVLFFGILGALIFRGAFIAAGVALINNFEWIIYVFGAFLIWTAFRMVRNTEEVHPENNPVLTFFQRRFPTTTRYDGQRLLTIESGRRVATPLFVCLLFIETTDIVFAVDSIPAIFAVTRDPFIVLTSNVFAILGLRALYFLLAGSVDRFHLLKYGLAVVLGFVGIKMLVVAFGIHVPVVASLVFITLTLTVTIIASLRTEPSEEQKLMARSLRFPKPDEVAQIEPQVEREQERSRASGEG
jgi:tellurite resistance protein TerC